MNLTEFSRIRYTLDGTLPHPNLGIRFLMMPELSGTAAYFHHYPD